MEACTCLFRFFDNRMFAMSRFNQGLRCLAQCMQVRSCVACAGYVRGGGWGLSIVRRPD